MPAVCILMKKIAIALSIFPGSLFVIALVSFVVCSIVELGLAGGGANIGLGLLALAALINLPTFVVWIVYLANLRDEGRLEPQLRSEKGSR